MAVKEKAVVSTNGATHINGNGASQNGAAAAAPTSFIGPTSINLRRTHRKICADFWYAYPLALQQPNGDEAAYGDFRGNFSKGLPHNASGLVDPTEFGKLTQAFVTGDPADFDNIPTATPGLLTRKYVNPQAGLALEMLGPDPEHLAVVAAPAFNSAANVAEITENYWMALMRDIPFSAYSSHPLIGDAIADFEKTLSGGTKLRQELFYRDAGASAEALTAQTLFRGVFPGERVGPHISQFLLQDCFLGSQQIDQRMWTVMPGIDYMTTFSKWLDVQRGVKQAADVHDPQVRYMRNGRDLGQWVHVDQLYQAYVLAALQLLGGDAELSDSNPYKESANQDGFATFGGPKVLSLVTEVATRALKAVWYQKWAVHRRLRPEAFAGRIHAKYIGGADGVAVPGFDINSAIEEASVLSRIYSTHGSLLLPMAFPEGSPMHPAYGAGHATVAGACTTILKALFKGSNSFNSLRHPRTKAQLVAVEAAPNGLSRQNYTGPDANCLTIEGELNKLAGNIAIGRNFAGVHWRSDYRESMLLGEKVAIGTLMDYVGTFNEPNVSFTFQSFTDHTVTVRDHQVEIGGVPVIQQVDSYNQELIGLESKAP